MKYKKINSSYIGMRMAKYASKFSTDKQVSVGVYAVGEGFTCTESNRNNSPELLNKLHAKGFCLRKWLRVKSGSHYWLCPCCVSPKGHAEYRAVQIYKRKGNSEPFEIYMSGHTKCCKSCTKALKSVGCTTVYVN